MSALKNPTKNLGFLRKNRLVFAFQQNIIENEEHTKYERWFRFAEKTRDGNNTEQDFEEFQEDKVFKEMIRRLNKGNLTEEDFEYISNEKEFWNEFEKMEQSYYDTGRNHGYEEGIHDGKAKGKKEGKLEGKTEMAKALKKQGVDLNIISQTSGLTIEEIEKL